MKIALIRQRYVQTGGAERHLDTFLQSLCSRGHEVHLFATAWPAPGNSPVHLHHVPVFPFTSALRMVSFAAACRKQVAQLRPDLVFSLERTFAQDIYRAGDGCHRQWLAERARYSPAWKRAQVSLNPFHLTVLALEAKVFSPSRTKRVIANSRRGKEEILRHYRFPGEAIDVIYNGVDLQKFAPRPKGLRNEVVLLFVGSGFERKGLRFCLETLAQLPARYRLEIVGKDREGPYRRLAEQLGIGDRAQFLGSRGDMPSIYQRADILLHPAIYEPFANVCLEAMASGLPVITSRANGASELIEQGVNGGVVEQPNEIRAMAERIEQIQSRWLDASHHARATAERFPLETHVRQTLDVIERVLNSKFKMQNSK